MPVAETIVEFLRQQAPKHNDPNLLARCTANMEMQVNVREVVRGADGKPNCWNIRSPKNADSNPEPLKYNIRWPLAEHATDVGMSGWNHVDSGSLYVAFDIDFKSGHAKGHDQSTIDSLVSTLSRIPWIELRRSTSGKGLHVYVHFAVPIPTANHAEHAALAKAVLACISAAVGFDLAPYVDVYGGIMWVWSTRATAENGGLSLIKPATQSLTLQHVPNWREYLPAKREPLPARDTSDLDTPIDIFNASEEVPMSEMLIEWGAEPTDDSESRWRLPGDEGHDDHATLFRHSESGIELLTIFSTSVELDGVPVPEGTYTKARLLETVKFGGNSSAMASDLMRRGYAPEHDADDDFDAVFESAKPAARKFQIVSLGDLQTSAPTPQPEVIKRLLQVGDVANLIAPPKLGKSFFVAQLLVSFIANLEWLGFQFGTSPRRVLVIDNELKPYDLVNRIAFIAEKLGVPISLVFERIDVVSLRGNTLDMKQIATEMHHVAPGTYSLIVVDAVYRTLGDWNENSNQDMSKFYNLLEGMANRLQAAVIGVHHTSKGDQSDRAVTDVGSGAGTISRAVDCHMILRPHDTPECFALEFAVRNFKAPLPMVLRREWPLWVVEPMLDPSDLKRPGSKPKPEFRDLREILMAQDGRRMNVKLLREALQDRTGCAERPAAALVKSAEESGILNRIPGENRTYDLVLGNPNLTVFDGFEPVDDSTADPESEAI